MAITNRLRREHDVATMMTGELRDLVHRQRPGDDAIGIALQLARLLGVLRVHLATEDTFLYPALIATQDPVAEPLARRFRAEMGALAWQFEEFMRLWSSSAVIALDFAAFEAALERLLGALDVRITRENSMLYKVADALIAEPPGAAA